MRVFTAGDSKNRTRIAFISPERINHRLSRTIRPCFDQRMRSSLCSYASSSGARRSIGDTPGTCGGFNTALPFDGIVEYILEDLGIAKPEESPARRLTALNNFLVERERAGQNTTLIIDEAQNLDTATLEQVSLLSNFESTTSTRLQIVFVGPPELEAKLNHPDLRHLQERVSLRCQIPPLGAKEADQYIRGRLQVAGAPDVALFNERAIDRITQYSGGIPRVINILGDHCLLFGYADQKRRIDRHIVNQAIAYLEQDAHPPREVFSADGLRSLRRFRWVLSVAVELAVVAQGALRASGNPV
jgi:hypothetical protein